MMLKSSLIPDQWFPNLPPLTGTLFYLFAEFNVKKFSRQASAGVQGEITARGRQT
jgi:hypothetical protein